MRLIDADALIDALDKSAIYGWSLEEDEAAHTWAELVVELMPSAEPTLYGYKIEHLAYIARVMEKEGVTAEYAARTFDDMSRALRLIIEEAQERVLEVLNERHDI